jgi:hypothetical protein
MTAVLIPSSQLGLLCSPSACACGFGSSDDGIIGAQYIASLSLEGIVVAPSVSDYLSAENFSNSGDSVAEILLASDGASIAACPASCPVIMSPAPDLLDLIKPSTVDLMQQQRMLGGDSNPAFRRVFESLRRMQRRSASAFMSGSYIKDMSSLRRTVVGEIGRGCDMVTYRFGKNALVIPPASPSFVDEDGVGGWRALADGRAGSSNTASRAALASSMSDAAALSGMGDSVASEQKLPSDLSSAPSYRSRVFCFHMSAGYPLGCSAFVDGTALPSGHTYREPLSTSVSSNFSHHAMSSASKKIFRESGASVGYFSKRLMNPPTHIAMSGVVHDSFMSSSWYGMLPMPSYFIDDMVRPFWLGMSDAGLQPESLIIADDLERLISIATSPSHPRRYSVRRCLEHQFLHRKLKLRSHLRTRTEGTTSSISSLSWNVETASPDLGSCLPDEMWCDLDDANGHDWKSLIATCGGSDSSWQAYRYSRPGLPSVNPFLGMRISPSDFNSPQASAIASLPSLGAREVVDMIRWEFFEWTRQVGIHMVNLIAAKGRYVAADIGLWKTMTHGQVEV